MLFEQAVKAGWLGGSEANFLNWMGAAVRATTVNARDPVRVFVSLVKKGHWNFVTQGQEDRARVLMRRLRETSMTAPQRIQAVFDPVEMTPLPGAKSGTEFTNDQHGSNRAQALPET